MSSPESRPVAVVKRLFLEGGMHACRVEGEWFLWLATRGFAVIPVQAQKPDL